MLLDLPFTSYEFQGADGQIHRFYGCSLIGKFEFVDRLSELAIALDNCPEYLTPEGLYWSNSRFRYVCDRCLELNGIKAEWVNWAIMEALLLKPDGVLVQINTPKAATSPLKVQGKPQTLEEVLAILAEAEGSIQGAIATASQYPSSVVEGVLAARAELHKTPEQKKKDQVAAQVAARSAAFDPNRAIALGENVVQGKATVIKPGYPIQIQEN